VFFPNNVPAAADKGAVLIGTTGSLPRRWWLQEL